VPSGAVVVLNVWGSWCGPCVAEAPELEKAWTQLPQQGQPVQFVGLDFKEGPEAGLAFQRRYGVSYPSLRFDGGRPVQGLQGLQGKAPTVPTTLVLDGSRRIAGRILGQTNAATLTGLVADVLAQEQAAGINLGASR
jgi:thiol-disulfide isomerase/thioredoxin